MQRIWLHAQKTPPLTEKVRIGPPLTEKIGRSPARPTPLTEKVGRSSIRPRTRGAALASRTWFFLPTTLRYKHLGVVVSYVSNTVARSWEDSSGVPR